jgi:beta-lactam-binding protein with PASTA domain
MLRPACYLALSIGWLLPAVPGRAAAAPSTTSKALIAVPNVVGSTLDSAKTKLGQSRLQVAVGPPGQALPAQAGPADEVVAAQSPAAGAAVPANTQVTLTPKLARILVPNVTGKSLDSAGQALAAVKLTTVHAPVEKITTTAANGGLVAEQSPQAGQTADLFSPVTLTTFKALIAVPNVVGLPAGEAEKLLHLAHLRTAIIPGPTTLDKKTAGLVSAQTPVAGQSVARDTLVTLTTYTARIQ